MTQKIVIRLSWPQKPLKLVIRQELELSKLEELESSQ